MKKIICFFIVLLVLFECFTNTVFAQQNDYPVGRIFVTVSPQNRSEIPAGSTYKIVLKTTKNVFTSNDLPLDGNTNMFQTPGNPLPKLSTFSNATATITFKFPSPQDKLKFDIDFSILLNIPGGVTRDIPSTEYEFVAAKKNIVVKFPVFEN